ncbi:MAG: hypothetical protein J6O49_04900 [Bacteroidaceae bacterium]|nr:hypothetical protein [Bacteroidaceae bacterium]
MSLETFQKIDTLYKRYQFSGKDCPNQKWLKFRNKIILGAFSNIEAKYLFDCLWEAYSKIDGTNSKIAFFPSTGEIKVGGKSDNAESLHGQFEMLQKIGDRIQPELVKMFPKESARFTPVKDKETNKVQYWDKEFYDVVEPIAQDFFGVELEEIPVYIYGEYFGCGVQKGGGRYVQNGNDFLVFDIRQQGWWTPKDVRDSLCKGLGLKTVPYLGQMTLRDIEQMVMNGFTTKYENAADPTLIEEGIVARPVIPLCNGGGKRIIVKVKYCDYIEYKRVRDEFTDEEFREFSEWYKTIENV